MTGRKNNTLILGLGNPILSEDGIGLLITKNIDGKITGADTASITLAGLELLDILAFTSIALISSLFGSRAH